MFGYFVRSNKKENIQQNIQMQNEIIIFIPTVQIIIQY